MVAGAILNFTKEQFSNGELLSVIATYMKYLATQNAKLADTIVSDQQRAFDKVVESYTQRKFIEPVSKNKEETDTEKKFLINENRRLHLEYYKNTCIAFFIPAAYTAMAILEKDSFRFSASDLHAGYGFWQSFFKYEFAYDVDIRSKFHVRKSVKALIDDGIVIPHQTLPDTYDVTPAGFRKLKLFAFFLKTYFESYWIVLNFFMRNPARRGKTQRPYKKNYGPGEIACINAKKSSVKKRCRKSPIKMRLNFSPVRESKDPTIRKKLKLTPVPYKMP